MIANILSRRLPLSFMRRFLELEASSGILLCAMAALALLIDNSPLSQYYHLLFELKLTLGLGSLIISKQLITWINDGLMAFFFLLAGLEIKREMLEGELNTLSKAALPAIAAVGGMVLPVLIYMGFNWNNPATFQGWGIPAATDIAFSLAILSLLGSRVPQSLRMFLLSLAIFDDMGAIILIAVFYSTHIALHFLVAAIVLTLLLLLLNRLNVILFAPYFIIGALLWFCLLKSGIHATVTGIILALMIPLRDANNPLYSPTRHLEKILHPWVAYFILPLFALANAGVSLQGLSGEHFTSTVTVGIALGLFLGKQLGIWGTCFLAIRLGWAKLPENMSMLGLYGIGIIAGVGFTMSLFIGSFAFTDLNMPYAVHIRIGVIGGSLLSGIVGYLFLRYLGSVDNSSTKS